MYFIQLIVKLHKRRVREAAVRSVLFNADNIFASNYFSASFLNSHPLCPSDMANPLI